MKQTKKTFIIIVVVLMSVITIISMIFAGKIIINELLSEQKNKKEIEFFKQKAIEYMKNKYNIEFTATIESNGFKRHVSGLDGSTFYCGHDRDIKEYIFEVKPNIGNEISYVTIHQNIRTREIDIKETYGSSSTDTSYKLIHELELFKMEIQKIVEQHNVKVEVTNRIDKSINGENDIIYMNLDYNNIDEINQNMEWLDDIIKLLQGKRTEIIINFSEVTLKINEKTKTEDVKIFYELVKDVDLFIKENYSETYKLYNKDYDSKYSIKIKFDKNLKDEFYGAKMEKYSKIYSYLLQKCKNNNFGFSLEFEDESIHIKRYSPNTLEEYYDIYIERLE